MKLMSLALVALMSTAAHAAPVQDATHAYGLNKSYADELGGNPLQAQGGRFTPTRYRFKAGEGLTLSGAVQPTHYSIQMQLAPADVTGYRRLIGFRLAGSDAGLYVNNGSLEFYPLTTGAPVTFQADKLANVVITRDAASRIVTLYVDGVQQASFEDDQRSAEFDVDPDGNSFARFFIDDNGEDAAGTLNHLRVFDQVLTPAEVRKLANGKLPGNVTSK